ncbi:YybH family protein [Mesoterricola silvestris]|uniref:SnoaL-like domain-containing protein n=1 Tax=Mesoterricola silvestris TaxID=2927979 RepID=A0AA48GR42_9BACT|nr:SgcJ/EcaC family oxidoreductase [Mesoterricola silvestris]BDU72690.1 hypothetical protein METEAL_18640 [Mesoterricola silvestris]
MHELESIIHAADQAINREDLDAVVDFYTEDATLVVQPGVNATGKAQIRKAFTAIVEHFNHTLHVRQDKLIVLEGGPTALVLGQADIRFRDAAGLEVRVEREATYVFTRDPQGAWRCAVDNSYGTSLLRS